MRLIDADRLLDAMKRSTGVFSPMVVKNLIDNSETVFDKDKVIEELKKAECSRNLETVAYRQKALEIVERGGVDGN